MKDGNILLSVQVAWDALDTALEQLSHIEMTQVARDTIELTLLNAIGKVSIVKELIKSELGK